MENSNNTLTDMLLWVRLVHKNPPPLLDKFKKVNCKLMNTHNYVKMCNDEH